MWPFDRKIEKSAVSFSDILTGLQNAISGVQGMLQSSQLQNLSNFWERDGKPVSQPVKFADRTVDVPLVTLVPHSQLAMDTVEIKFSTRVSSIVSNTPADTLTNDKFAGSFDGSNFLSQADFQVAMDGVRADGENVMQVSIVFKIKDTPEAVSRLVDEYNKSI